VCLRLPFRRERVALFRGQVGENGNEIEGPFDSGLRLLGDAAGRP
jgi:hypothetical protein